MNKVTNKILVTYFVFKGLGHVIVDHRIDGGVDVTHRVPDRVAVCDQLVQTLFQAFWKEFEIKMAEIAKRY